MRSLAFLFGALVVAPALTGCGNVNSRHELAYDGGSLSIDGGRVALSAAQFHYWQLPSPALWPETFRRIKEARYNAVALDLYWGYHSARPGAYDFSGARRRRHDGDDQGNLERRAAAARLALRLSRGVEPARQQVRRLPHRRMSYR
jgi:hypothetical protein